jgi:hypothetical protein
MSDKFCASRQAADNSNKKRRKYVNSPPHGPDSSQRQLKKRPNTSSPKGKVLQRTPNVSKQTAANSKKNVRGKDVNPLLMWQILRIGK